MDLKKQIKEKGYRIGFIAQTIGISNVLLSYYLNKARPMPEHIKYKILEFLNPE